MCLMNSILNKILMLQIVKDFDTLCRVTRSISTGYVSENKKMRGFDTKLSIY